MRRVTDSAVCEHCTKARDGVWCGYHARCIGCAARAAARCFVTFDAVRTRNADGMRDLLGRVLPSMPYQTARALVLGWWAVDHPKTSRSAGAGP